MANASSFQKCSTWGNELLFLKTAWTYKDMPVVHFLACKLKCTREFPRSTLLETIPPFKLWKSQSLWVFYGLIRAIRCIWLSTSWASRYGENVEKCMTTILGGWWALVGTSDGCGHMCLYKGVGRFQQIVMGFTLWHHAVTLISLRWAVWHEHSEGIVHIWSKSLGQLDPKLTQVGQRQVRFDQTQVRVCVCVCVCVRVCVCVQCTCGRAISLSNILE